MKRSRWLEVPVWDSPQTPCQGSPTISGEKIYIFSLHQLFPLQRYQVQKTFTSFPAPTFSSPTISGFTLLNVSSGFSYDSKLQGENLGLEEFAAKNPKESHHWWAGELLSQCSICPPEENVGILAFAFVIQRQHQWEKSLFIASKATSTVYRYSLSTFDEVW